MDITLYALIAVASVVLLLAMWACAASGVNKWGPDLTSELPPHLLREIFMVRDKPRRKAPLPPLPPRHRTENVLMPSAPTDKATAPLLEASHPMEYRTTRNVAPTYEKASTSTHVRVLPKEFIQMHNLRPVRTKGYTKVQSV